MTCLYCGKKLGFFTRYKDTPFCSEEHLRSHQDELERALMERLGSKAVAPPRDKAKNAPVPVAERPLSKPAPGADQEDIVVPVHVPPDPAPLYEGFFLNIPDPLPVLEVDKPLFSPASFAIIVQADCCTPSTPDAERMTVPPIEEADFDLTPDSIQAANVEFAASVPRPAGVDTFGEPWLFFPEPSPKEILVETSEPDMEHELFDLNFEAVLEHGDGGLLGGRDFIPVRPRHRYPYAASEITSQMGHLAQEDSILPWTAAEEWDAVEPVREKQLVAEDRIVVDEQPNPLSIAALLLATRTGLDSAGSDSGGVENAGGAERAQSFQLTQGPQQPYLSSEALDQRLLAAPAALGGSIPASAIEVSLVRPLGPTTWQPSSRWRGFQASRRITPVPFPSLFQVGSVLPPRPEVMTQ
jgi:hypothetical protein